MAAKKNITGYHIEVESTQNSMYRYDDEERVRDQKSTCEDMVQQIKRHVDNIDSIDVIEELEMVCEYCGYAWTEGESSYNGGCCDEDEKDFMETQNKPCGD